MSETDDIVFFSFSALIFIPLGTWLVISDFRNRAFSDSQDLNISIRSWVTLIVGIFILFAFPWTKQTIFMPVLISTSYLLAAAYILVFRPGFKYTNDEKENIPSFQSFDEANRIFLSILAIVFLIFSLMILSILGIKLFSNAGAA